MDATATSKIESWDNISFVLVFNSIGWKSQNLLFNAIDAIMGDPLIRARSTARSRPRRPPTCATPT